MNIVLIGYRGSGKSTVGRRLAKRLGRGFADIDAIIERRQGSSIREIVESLGWEHFRAMEKAAVEEISRRSGFIIAPGGGAVLDPENVRSLRNKGLIVWLKAKPEVLAERMGRDAKTINGRPTLTGKGTLAEIREVATSRDSIYREAAAIELDTSPLDIEAVVEKILSIVQNRSVQDEGHCEDRREARAAGQSPAEAKLPLFGRNEPGFGK